MERSNKPVDERVAIGRAAFEQQADAYQEAKRVFAEQANSSNDQVASVFVVVVVVVVVAVIVSQTLFTLLGVKRRCSLRKTHIDAGVTRTAPRAVRTTSPMRASTSKASRSTRSRAAMPPPATATTRPTTIGTRIRPTTFN
jgi:hypothetical protein